MKFSLFICKYDILYAICLGKAAIKMFSNSKMYEFDQMEGGDQHFK